MSSLTLEDIDSVSEVDRDTLAPLPPPTWNNVYHNPYGPTPAYMPPPPPGAYIPPKPYNYTPNDSASYVSMPQGNGSIHSGSGKSSTVRYSLFLLLGAFSLGLLISAKNLCNNRISQSYKGERGCCI